MRETFYRDMRETFGAWSGVPRRGATLSRMGKLFYGDSGTSIEVDDRTLAHLKIAVFTKLRRNESFTLSWQHGADAPTGRSTLWLHPSIPLHFIFDEDEPPQLNREWIEQLMRSANSTGGIELLPEEVALNLPRDTIGH